jgi:hypothetical protein
MNPFTATGFFVAKRTINWTEIEARYKAGEKPADIAKDYKCCTSAQIRTKASRGGWSQQRETVRDTVLQQLPAAIVESVTVSRQSLIDELAGIAHGDMRDFLLDMPNGYRFKTMAELTPQQSKIIQKIKVKQRALINGQDQQILETTVEFSLYNKLDAIEQLARMHGYDQPDKGSDKPKRVVIAFEEPELMDIREDEEETP